MKRFDPKTVTDEELIRELIQLAEKLGKVPSRNDMMNGTPMTKRLYLYGKRFGGLTQACKEAGLVANKGGKYAKYTEKELLDHILELHKKTGKTPRQQDINDEGKYAIGAYKRHFGTYNKALEKIGLRHNTKFGISEQEIIDDIIKLSKKLGRSPMVTEFDKYSNTVTHVTAYEKLNCNFSWNSVLKKCGLKVIHNRNITNEELKEEVIRLEKQIGRIPGYYDMLQLGVYSPETYSDRFGSYLRALEDFGYDYIPQNQWNNQSYTKGKDGTLYKSKFEANIADSLFSLKLANKILSYEYEKPVCKDRQWTCDFYIETNSHNIWIEADGMGKNRNDPYDIDNEKIDFYNENNFKYLIIPYKKIDLLKYLENLLTTVYNVIEKGAPTCQMVIK